MASAELAVVSGAQEWTWLRTSSQRLVAHVPVLISANMLDLDAAPGFGLTDATIASADPVNGHRVGRDRHAAGTRWRDYFLVDPSQ
jgi:hypothetical protein